ncbi:Crp/Fnr family transcriptional regulator [Mucilaginibacter corticis]|uniref:Crp/Fnr family transcriptional regulator n=1 Tax=Mucilaginibacter corticis TaxID=2597670 RepID=A0A556M9D8_9SPHI|nr:Crp/Fnr family transcriptional regulator [Mucilaginibacter corticis]TSJ36512.1 Crp/Fnr family transcriptional regulator [Mucilaginibacter corticis]
MLYKFRELWEQYQSFQRRLDVGAKTLLLEEGQRSEHYIYIEKGAVRTYFNNNGEDKTVQFFFEGEGLMAIESFMNDAPSPIAIETIEPSVLYLLPKPQVLEMVARLGAQLVPLLVQRQIHYMHEFVSFIRDTPEQRYQQLLTERPQLILRVPQHYIASYLGISKVHLSRIKSKLAKGKRHF